LHAELLPGKKIAPVPIDAAVVPQLVKPEYLLEVEAIAAK
jgi:hypothetical protein